MHDNRDRRSPDYGNHGHQNLDNIIWILLWPRISCSCILCLLLCRDTAAELFHQNEHNITMIWGKKKTVSKNGENVSVGLSVGPLIILWGTRKGLKKHRNLKILRGSGLKLCVQGAPSPDRPGVCIQATHSRSTCGSVYPSNQGVGSKGLGLGSPIPTVRSTGP